ESVQNVAVLSLLLVHPRSLFHPYSRTTRTSFPYTNSMSVISLNVYMLSQNLS
ncbi:hypothetical protein L9F63_025858, partial [Diploptera punctata]